MEKTKDRFFSVELTSKNYLKNVSLSNGGCERVLIEGTIGKLQHADFAENIVLEIVGDKGVLRIILSQEEIQAKKTQEKEVLE